MPKASIDEYCQTMLPKDKVGVAEYFNAPPPAGDVVLPKKLNKYDFRGFVALPTNVRHDL